MAKKSAAAWPSALDQADQHFASGVNTPGEIVGLALSGRHFGITATEISDALLDEIERFGGPGLQRLFVDSGAFSEVAWNPATFKFDVVKPIRDADWQHRFQLYAWAADHYGPRAYVVAPDRVGDQGVTLERLARYAPQVAAVAARGASIIVPVQRGELPLSTMFQLAVSILGLRDLPIVGVPSKKSATSLDELAELAASLPPGARFHLLGVGPESKRFAPMIATIRQYVPDAVITSDSVTIRRLVGRTNGPRGGPRALTRYQDEGRARGLPTSAEIKAYGLQRQGADEARAAMKAALDAGWYDDELFDSIEEARAAFAKSAQQELFFPVWLQPVKK